MEITTTIDAGDDVDRHRDDLVEVAETLSIDEVRYLVDAYYAIQKYRTVAASQVRALGTGAGRIHQNCTVEKDIEHVLDRWTETLPVARWAKSIVGIGPVISAGLVVTIDIQQAPTVGHIWRFAGLDPTQNWIKGRKCPWNPKLKRLTWLIGENFATGRNHERDFYGRLYAKRKHDESAANEAGRYADQARREFERVNVGSAGYRWYAQGKLPPSHIHARAKRWAVKLFLAHYHHVAWTLATGEPPPKPYVISLLGNGQYITPPNFNGGAK